MSCCCCTSCACCVRCCWSIWFNCACCIMFCCASCACCAAMFFCWLSCASAAALAAASAAFFSSSSRRFFAVSLAALSQLAPLPFFLSSIAVNLSSIFISPENSMVIFSRVEPSAALRPSSLPIPLAVGARRSSSSLSLEPLVSSPERVFRRPSLRERSCERLRSRREEGRCSRLRSSSLLLSLLSSFFALPSPLLPLPSALPSSDSAVSLP
mmetsp:Transcript_18433/g.39680  ORF Transcript_18433/g.39680 Transcript_18433/m.39680 type:complete len:212 (+) Transcript_18433:1038-1673(+)